MIKLKSVIRDVATNFVEATWTIETAPAYDVPESQLPDALDEKGNILYAGKIIPAHTIPAVQVNVKSQFYHETQMDLLEADLGSDLPAYASLIATVRAAIHQPSPSEIAALLVLAKTGKNMQINEWRGQANQTSFTHAGKQIACDPLSRSDIDAVASSIALTGTFPASFPGAWKAMDNSYIVLANVAAFKAMYASMTAQGTANFARSQSLKTALAGATTIAQVNAIQWA